MNQKYFIIFCLIVFLFGISFENEVDKKEIQKRQKIREGIQKFNSKFQNENNTIIQLHLALTENLTEMRASWASNSSITQSICEYGLSSGQYSQRVVGYNYTYTDGGFDGNFILFFD